jgi:hypothetical protein
VGFALLAVVVIVAGGYLMSIATPCLCFDVNGIMLLAGLAVVMAGAGMLLFASDIARVVTDQAMRRLPQEKRQAAPPIQ